MQFIAEQRQIGQRQRPAHLRAFAVLASAVLFLQACSNQPLEPGHTAALTEEYRAARADEVRTFEDYLRLEDRLFAQLESKVYARTETGPGTAPSGLLNVRWEDMAAATQLAAEHLAQKVGQQPLHIVGTHGRCRGLTALARITRPRRNRQRPQCTAPTRLIERFASR